MPAPIRNKNKELGRKHRERAAALKRSHIPGTLCWWCGEPMMEASTLQADHSKARKFNPGSVADRLLHGPCNRERGDGSHDDERPALKKMERYGGCAGNVFDWPVLPKDIARQ